MFRFASILLVATALLVIASGAAFAADKSHDGKVVSVSEGKLVMTDNDGQNEHSHAIAVDTTITLNGKTAKLADLKAGDKITVTQNDANKVTKVAATRAG